MGFRRVCTALAAAAALVTGFPAGAQQAPTAPEIDWFGIYSQAGRDKCVDLIVSGLPKLGYQVVSSGGLGTPIVARHASLPVSLAVFCDSSSALGAISGPASERGPRWGERERLKRALQSELARSKPDTAAPVTGSVAAPRLAPAVIRLKTEECVAAAKAVLIEAGFADARYEDGAVRGALGARAVSAIVICGSLGQATMVLAAAPGEGFDVVAAGARLSPLLTQRAEVELAAAYAREAADIGRRSEAACRTLETAGGVAAADWAWLNLRREQGFSLTFPTYPCVTVADGPRGRETLYTAMVAGVSYTLSVTDAAAPTAPEAVFNTEVDRLRGDGATVLAARRAPLENDPGAIAWISRPLPSGGQARATLRYVIHKGRLYRLSVAYAAGRDVAADMQKFGDSLKF